MEYNKQWENYMEKYQKLEKDFLNFELHGREPKYRTEFNSAVKDFNEALMNGLDLKSIIDNHKKLYGPEYLLLYLQKTLDLSELSNRIELHKRVSACSKHSHPVARDYYSIKIRRLFKGKRSN